MTTIKWYGQGKIEVAELEALGVAYNSMITGEIPTGEFTEEQVPLTRPGIIIDFKAIPNEAILQQIDLLIPLCIREGQQSIIAKLNTRVEAIEAELNIVKPLSSSTSTKAGNIVKKVKSFLAQRL